MKINANCGATSAAGSWNEPMPGSVNSAACWCVMSICSPPTVPSSTWLASGSRSGGIFETRSRLIAVVKNPVGIHVIERLIRKRQVVNVALDDCGFLANSFAGKLQMGIADIHASSNCAMQRELQEVTTRTTTQF